MLLIIPFFVMALARIQASIVKELRNLEIITEDDCNDILSIPDQLSVAEVEALLVEKLDIDSFFILVAKSKVFQIHPINVRNVTINEKTFEHLDKDFCVEHNVLPIGVVGSKFVVAMDNPFNLELTNIIQQEVNISVSILLGMESELREVIASGDSGSSNNQQEGYEGNVSLRKSVEDIPLDDAEEELKIEDDVDEESAPIIQLSNRIIEDAYYSGGSDIHIEPFEKECRIRVRIDGVCENKLTIPRKAANSLLARIKVMANLDIAEKRLPQDGRIIFKKFTKKDLDIDLRVSTAPLNHGEGVVMRILDKQKSTLPLTALGFESENLEKYREVIQKPYGMILHCGPTGSGKSMTLYSALNEINKPDICIRTAEDPIEYTLEGLCQMQMQRKIGLTFANALRAFLRQDPDVILVGEIRDQETANIAVEAALTGHLLFSTLHTNDAPSTVARLTDMGVEPFMISSSLLCICAQRLLRRLDKLSKQSYQPSGRELEILQKAINFKPGTEVFKAKPQGTSSGYKGRIGIHEMMINNEQLVEAINEKAETAVLKRIAVQSGMATLHQDSLRKVVAGLTSIQEALSTVPPDMEDMTES